MTKGAHKIPSDPLATEPSEEGTLLDAAIFDNPGCNPLDVLTFEEVAAALKKTEKTIRNMVARREIPYMRIGRRTMFSRESLREWLQKKEVRPHGSK